MILRIAVFIVIVAALAVAGMFIADQPGRVAIEWGDYLIELSPAALVGAVAALAAIVVVVILATRWFWHGPRTVRRARALRRERLGYQVLTQGLVAAAAGDAPSARRLARRADALLHEPPLTLLLAAQAAQLEGKDEIARGYFSAMLERRETEFLGLRGLIVQASKAGDIGRARELAERAFRLKPDTPWLLTALLELRTRVADRAGAREVLERARRRGAVTPEAAARRAAGLNYEEALALRDAGDTRHALRLAERALATDPGLAPAAILAGQAALALGKRGRAARLIEAGFSAQPHPELGRLYLSLEPGANELQRFARLERLAALNPRHPESRRLIAEGAVAARLWGRARAELDVLVKDHASVSVHRLFARLEEAERQDGAAARRQLEAAAIAPADPGWACAACQSGLDAWSIACPSCGALDMIEWRAPTKKRGRLIESQPAAGSPPHASAATSPSAEPKQEPPAAEPVRPDA